MGVEEERGMVMKVWRIVGMKVEMIMVGKEEDIRHGMVEEEIEVMASVIETMVMIKGMKGKVKETIMKTIEAMEIEMENKIVGKIMEEIKTKMNRGIETDTAGIMEKIQKDNGGKVVKRIKNTAGIMEEEEDMIVEITTIMEEVGEGTMIMKEVEEGTEVVEEITEVQEEKKEIGIEEGKESGRTRGRPSGNQ